MAYKVTVMTESPTPVDGVDTDGKDDIFWLKNGAKKNFEEINNREELEDRRVRIDNINSGSSSSSSDDDDSEDDES